eukprot:GHVU01041528.1.p1 GENE.GHVU01041528.1~~GHVU01041528.1.p1  ORF type:complete len:231 (+),score=24.24 GHVU01041528.1:1057-1749(+)
MQVVVDMCKCFRAPLDTALSLAQHLESLSHLGHMCYCLFRANSKQFIPTVLFHDLQTFIKGVFVLTCRGQSHSPEFSLCMGQAGSDALEEVFSLVRTLNHSSNFTSLELQSNLKIVSDIQGIMQRHPTWKPQDKRRDVTPTSDRSRVSSEQAEATKISAVDVCACWAEGRRRAGASLGELLDSELVTAGWDALRQDRVTLLCPEGNLVGCTDDRDDSEELLEAALLCSDE